MGNIAQHFFIKKRPWLQDARKTSLCLAGKNGILLAVSILLLSFHSLAQGDAKAVARMDAAQIAVGDQARLFIEVQHNPALSRIQWAVIPDTFNKLEVVERGKIDTLKQGELVTYRQRLIVTGFDSGVFKVPAFAFSAIPKAGDPYIVQTDSFSLLVQTVPVDTTQAFKGIKGIIYVKSSWRDYILWIVAGAVLVVLAIIGTIYFIRRRKAMPASPQAPGETLQEYTLRLLNELEAKQLWQKKQVKEYYVALTDIVRGYIEDRFHTAAMELTTDEILGRSLEVKELQPYHDILLQILTTADLAKFAKFEPLPREHTESMENAKQFIMSSKPAIEMPVNNGSNSAENQVTKANENPIG